MVQPDGTTGGRSGGDARPKGRPDGRTRTTWRKPWRTDERLPTLPYSPSEKWQHGYRRRERPESRPDAGSARNTKLTTPPELRTRVFSTRGSVISPDYLPLLLILSGDIETNPGPTYPCATCGTTTQRSRQGSLRCPQCGVWTHYNKRCAGVKHRHTIPPGWLCLSCHPTHNITQQPPPATPQQPKFNDFK